MYSRYLPRLAHYFHEVIDDLILVSTINVDKHVAAILKVASHERRRSHVLQCNDLHIGVPKLYLRNVPKHEVSARQGKGLCTVDNVEICSFSPGTSVMVPVCVVVYAEDLYFILQY